MKNINASEDRSDRKLAVAGIGELLWDLFPSGKRMGGAPANFACHCRQLGASANIVSRVGDDELGREIRKDLAAFGVSTDALQKDDKRPTGTVNVKLHDGHPSYEICEGVAWDFISMTPDLIPLALHLNAVCFGSLAQRCENSRNTIHNFIRAVPADALKIFDVNIRQLYYSKELIEESLQLANILKISDEELPIVSSLLGLTGSPKIQLSSIVGKFGLKLAALTCGAKGSMIVTKDSFIVNDGVPAEVVDTVGAGDSFTATLCMGLLRNRPLAEVNEHANRIAAFVCSQQGAVPPLPENMII